MGLVREPDGVDLVVGPSTLTPKDKKAISDIIKLYKLTGKVPSKSDKTKQQNSIKVRITKRRSAKNKA